MAELGKALFWVLAIPFGLWLKALVGVALWGWFVVPLGVPAVGMVHALGLSLVGWYFGSGMDHVHMKREVGWEKWVTVQLVVLIIWGYGAVFNWIGV
jgi:uncharacterized membrane protein AbrB (regulator of aidB expression)